MIWNVCSDFKAQSCFPLVFHCFRTSSSLAALEAPPWPSRDKTLPSMVAVLQVDMALKADSCRNQMGMVKTMVQEHQQSWWVDVESIAGPYSFSSWNAHWILSAHSKTPDWYVSTYSPRPFKQRNAWVVRRRIIIPITITYYKHTNNCLWSIAIACAYLHTMIALFVDAPLNTALATSCWRVPLQQLPPVRWSHRCGTRQLQQAHFRSARVPRSLDFQCMSLLDAKSWVVDHGKAKWNDKENCIRETYKHFKIILVITYVWYVLICAMQKHIHVSGASLGFRLTALWKVGQTVTLTASWRTLQTNQALHAPTKHAPEMFNHDSPDTIWHQLVTNCTWVETSGPRPAGMARIFPWRLSPESGWCLSTMMPLLGETPPQKLSPVSE